jgi:hypothetical protein
MTDSDFVDVGDELILRVGSYPVGRKLIVWKVDEAGVHAYIDHGDTEYVLPLNIKDYDTTDGVAHGNI